MEGSPRLDQLNLGNQVGKKSLIILVHRMLLSLNRHTTSRLAECFIPVSLIFEASSFTISTRTTEWCRRQVRMLHIIWHLPCRPSWAKFRHCSKIKKTLGHFVWIGKIIKQNLQTFLCYWANVHCCEWPKIENIIKANSHPAWYR